MSRIQFAATVVASISVATLASAGGVERSTQSLSILFEDGDYVQFGVRNVDPSLTGTFAGTTPSGDMAPSYTSANVGFKKQVSDAWSYAFIFDQSNGADVAYPASPGYPFAGVNATLDVFDITGVVKYRMPSNVSVYGGLRLQTLSADLDGLPIATGPLAPSAYSLGVDTNRELGYVLGVAYEKPEIALRVALTYNSEFEHSLASTETFTPGPTFTGDFTTTLPQSVNLEFQSGVAEDTLVFGSVRWVDWSEFDISPPTLPAPLIDYQSDYTTYTLGVGRRFNDTWSGAVSISHEPASGDIQGNLAPRDGFTSLSLAGTYTFENIELSGGVSFIELGDATTQTIGAEFADNSAVGVGFRVGISF